MVSRQPADSQREPTWGHVAVVTYLRAPLGPFLTALRRDLDAEHNPEAHITFLPPRPLCISIDNASAQIQQIISSVEPFEVELGCVNVFPKTNILYLSVRVGYEELMNLHASLNQGGLFGRENFEFIPHLTLSGQLPTDDIESTLQRAESAWESSPLSRRFLIREMTLLWQVGSLTDKTWRRISSFQLNRANDVSAATQT